ncbi:beta-lactamase/transpeptidase-like protein, partial [Mariannaea sp. PMI_226]
LHILMEKAILQPLNLTNTTSQPSFGPDANFAETHFTLRDGQSLPFQRIFGFKNSLHEGAGGYYSNIDDMLRWSKAILDADKDPQSSPVIRGAATFLSNQVPLDSPSRQFRFYGMGWITTQLPGVMGLQGANAGFLSRRKLPVLGAGAESMVTYYHQGNAPGQFSAVFLFPETDPAVVVLTNSQTHSDAAGWLAQAYIAALFDFPNPANYTAIAVETRDSIVEACDGLVSDIAETRKRHAAQPPHNLNTYVGKYINSLGNFFIDICRHPTNKEWLEMRFQGLDLEAYNLHPYYGDVFEWSMDCDEQARKGRFPNPNPRYYEIHFNVSDGKEQEATTLSWAKMGHIRPNGIVMLREATHDTVRGSQSMILQDKLGMLVDVLA